jgi:DNA-dependent protein kinase catalytic subunit
MASIKDKAREDHPQRSSSIHSFLSTLTSVLQSRLINTFIEAMEDLTPPDILLKELFSSILRFLRHNQRKEALGAYQQFYQRVIDLERQSVSTDLIGEWHRAVAPILRSLFNEHFGVNGDKLKSIQPKRVFELQELILNETRLKAVRPKSVQLSSFSNWLANYELLANKTSEIIEIPGQYMGESMPNVSLHAKLVSFDRNIRVMNSLRRPVALTLRADDQHDYKFLVKSGEDLRLDQRVIQLLQSMNNILEEDKNCSAKDLHLTTYPVIPFTPKLGMIGWVNNTIPVKSVLNTVTSNPSLHSANERYAEFVRKFNPTGKPHEAHISLIEKGSRDEVVQTFTVLEELLPPDLFRRVLFSIAATPESFFVLRTRFARSYAVANICGYILGIGDRHLENYLLEISTGSMLLIDFGAAFGCGVLLGVPELMPFRFTRQFRNILSPLQSIKLLQLEMTTVLQALQLKQEQLLTLMDVFVKEPQIDWIQIAKKNTKSAFKTSYALSRSNSIRDSSRNSPNNNTEDENNFTSDDIRWLPKQKIAIAQAKLRGRNSACIMCDELREHPASTGHPSLIASAQAIVRGSADSLRATIGEYCLSVDEQVACLIEHASDPNILGRTWQGWYPLV